MARGYWVLGGACGGSGGPGGGMEIRGGGGDDGVRWPRMGGVGEDDGWEWC